MSATMKAETRPVFTLDDLPRFSPWPDRLLGLTEWQPRKKTPAEVTREYEAEKWGPLLERYRAAGDQPRLEVVEGWMNEGAEPTLCSVGPCFELLPVREALERHYGIVAEALASFLPAAAVVEFGAGYGSAILRIAARDRFRGMPFRACEYTSSGAELLRQIAAAACLDLKVGRCDLAAAKLTELPVPPDSIAFTCMAAHYIPHLGRGFVDAFCALAPKVVVHFEPCYEHCNPATLSGALRRRYIQLNDYNRNLVSVLRECEARGRIRMLRETPAVIGANPLLPISILAWEPVAHVTDRA